MTIKKFLSQKIYDPRKFEDPNGQEVNENIAVPPSSSVYVLNNTPIHRTDVDDIEVSVTYGAELLDVETTTFTFNTADQSILLEGTLTIDYDGDKTFSFDNNFEQVRVNIQYYKPSFLNLGYIETMYMHYDTENGSNTPPQIYLHGKLADSDAIPENMIDTDNMKNYAITAEKISYSIVDITNRTSKKLRFNTVAQKEAASNNS